MDMTAKPFTPTAPKIPQEGEFSLTLEQDEAPRQIVEWNTNELKNVEGEFTWKPRIGAISKSAEYEAGFARVSVEWRLGEDGATEEVEFFKSYPISLLSLAEALDAKEVLAEEQARVAKEQEYKKWSWGFMGVSAILFVLLLLSFADGTKVTSYATTAAQLPESGKIYGPFELKDVGRVHQITLRSSMSDNSSAWGGVELLNDQQFPVNAVQGDFWRESGYDSDGRWSESDLSKTYTFRLENAGEYYLRLYGENDVSSANASVSVEVTKNVMLSRYYFLALLFALGNAYSLRKFKTANPVYVMLGVAFAAVAILSLLASMEDD